ncbi:flagellar biosynthesis anti-sigma factor FlgM [Erwinia sorbitola]|uniref:Negative regulator of flagellin synthesis n=1 Tax=Erwinia sorbitola TaxID=2681984 RepID=A0A6I6EF57_9GAMM|nr:flagellar biosynthesis anti-sigma factor FlgM [Erwinia sorbitola]MTD26961.1 flagellar biosynthesis anti-sigma factor FlgM [Erwinia sorbitola]QGU88524.1 flagellar biosynthesis anti-sigma factor FlgM [Erwinia sorbitola]
MKITSNPLVAGGPLQSAPKSSAAESMKTATVAASAAAGPISQAQQTLREMPDVDNQRIAELKTAISQGELDLDPQSLSRSMMDYFRR